MCCAADSYADGLVAALCDDPARESRELKLSSAVLGWADEELQARSDALTSAIERKVVAVQTAAIKEHEAGGDTSAAQALLQVLVDAMVLSKILAKKRLQA